MPIYAYKCDKCNHQQDHLMSMSADHPPCPACQSTQYQRQISAAGFTLKGSGWYATDFKGSSVGGTKKSEQNASGAVSGASCGTGCGCHPH